MLAFAIWRLLQQMKRSDQKVPQREKVYNRFMVGSFLFGPSVMIASSFAVDKIPIALSLDKSSIDRRWPVII
jgi:hypothetical protein